MDALAVPAPTSDPGAGSVVASIPVGSNPAGLGYDSGNGYVYVANTGPGVPDARSNTVSVINGTDFVATVRVGANPYGVTYDSGNGYVYVTNLGSSNVSVVNGTILAATIPVGSFPYGIAYDSANGFVYVANYFTDNVSVISGTTLEATVPVGTYPFGVVYDSGNGYVYVTNGGSGNVSVISGTTVVATVSVGVNPYGIAYDSGNGRVYVANNNGGSSGTVSVIAGMSVVATVPVQNGPQTAAYDSGHNYVYVTNEGSGSVSVISGATNALVANVRVGSVPAGAAYDRGNGYVYVTNYGSGNVSVFNGTTIVATISVESNPEAVVYDTGNGFVDAANSGSNTVSVISTIRPLSPVTLAETGLPPGTSWSVTLAGLLNSSSTNTITFSEPNGTYSFTVGNVVGFAASPSSGSVRVNGAPVDLMISFRAIKYAVTFTETGLPAGTLWSVTLGGSMLSSNATAIAFSVPNGTYAFAVIAVPGYTPTPSTGAAVVNGTNVSQLITFNAVKYAVTFAQGGLPSGTLWSVTVAGYQQSSTTAVITFDISNGTYTYTVGVVPGYAPNPSSGTLSVNGAAASVPIAFTAITYSVTFTEGGLPSGTSWSVALGGETKMSTSAVISLDEANGTYPFILEPVPGYTASPSSGSVIVRGGAVSRTVAFTPVTYMVTFQEAGLPSGTRWSVTIGGATQNSTASSITFNEPNGTYTFSVGRASGYLISPSSGILNVSGKSTIQSIAFTATILGLPAAEGYALLAGIIIAVVAVGVLFVLRGARRRRDGPPKSP